MTPVTGRTVCNFAEKTIWQSLWVSRRVVGGGERGVVVFMGWLKPDAGGP